MFNLACLTKLNICNEFYHPLPISLWIYIAVTKSIARHMLVSLLTLSISWICLYYFLYFDDTI